MTTERLLTLHSVLEETDGRLKAGEAVAGEVWPSGFGSLDAALTGGFRSGELTLMGGPPGLGKTTFALQVIRNLLASNHHAVYFSYEHDTQSVLERLLVMEAAHIAGSTAVRLPRIRRAFEARHGSDLTLEERLADTEGGAEAVQTLQDYGPRLHIHSSSGSHTDVEAVRAVIEEIRRDTGQTPFVVIDYLQKIYVAPPADERRRVPRMSEDDRVTVVVEALKDMALEMSVPVFALVAVDKSGLDAGKRVRLRDLRGSSALAHEADIALILNDKFDVVARHHLMYNLANAETYREWVVISIEKNRNGVDNVDLEFRKRFEHSMFDSDGAGVVEQLIDERIFVG
ncbi:MAG: DnaB-like helicase C-terminal domain-containing protein [Dermatophilaceae bacterium]